MSTPSPIGKITWRDHSQPTTYSVESAWERLERWFTHHIPGMREGLNPPSSLEQIHKFEKQIGASLPAEVRQSYRIHNGQEVVGMGLVFGLQLRPLESVARDWEMWESGHRQNLEEGWVTDIDPSCSCFPYESVRQTYFDFKWIPLTYDSSGNHIGIDLNPGPNGVSGQVIIFGRDDHLHPVLAHSWGQFLTDLADELENGNVRIRMDSGEVERFDLDDPHKQHFHSVGMKWSRGKLGLRNLSEQDEYIWNCRYGK